MEDANDIQVIWIAGKSKAKYSYTQLTWQLFERLICVGLSLGFGEIIAEWTSA